MNLKLPANIKNGFDNYRLSTLVSLPIALTALVALGVAAFFGADDLLKVGAYVTDLVIIPAFVARLISASSYLGRIFDAFSRTMRIQAKGFVPVSTEDVPLGEAQKYSVGTLLSNKAEADRLIGNWEAWLTLLGIVLGVGLGVAAAVLLGAALPLTASFSAFAYPLYVAGFIGVIAGLFNRMGLILDNRNALINAKLAPNRDKTELKLMLVGAGLGLATGVVLLVTSSASLAVIAGLTPFVTMGVFPPVIAGIVFVLIAMSVFASAADYIAKSVTYLRSYRDAALNEKLTTTKRVMHEHRGSFIGVSLGTVLGIGISVTLALTTGILSGPLAVPLVGGLLITLTTIGIMGGLVARIARMVDRVFPAPAVVAGDEEARRVAAELRATGSMSRSPSGSILGELPQGLLSTAVAPQERTLTGALTGKGAVGASPFDAADSVPRRRVPSVAQALAAHGAFSPALAHEPAAHNDSDSAIRNLAALLERSSPSAVALVR